MKIVCLKGGLGNQMFEYCRFRDLMESGHDEVYLFYDHRRLKPVSYTHLTLPTT